MNGLVLIVPQYCRFNLSMPERASIVTGEELYRKLEAKKANESAIKAERARKVEAKAKAVAEKKAAAARARALGSTVQSP